MFNALVLGFVVSLVVGLALGPLVIKKLKEFHARQEEREEGPESHKYKAGTPTMGGILILFALTVSVLLFNGAEPSKLMALFLTLGNGLIGFADDSIKAVKKRNLGLTAKQKLAGQAVISVIFCIALKVFADMPTTVWIPFTDITVDLGIAYYLFVFLIIVGATNAVNLTDGLDGLAAGSSAITAVAYVVISVALGYGGIAIFGAALAGACLALGGAMAAMAILTKTELLLVIAGGLYVLEALSVILQVISFKTRGVRIFKMSPVHHHFELSGWSEVKVVTVFWLFSALVAIIAIVTVLGGK